MQLISLATHHRQSAYLSSEGVGMAEAQEPERKLQIKPGGARGRLSRAMVSAAAGPNNIRCHRDAGSRWHRPYF
jgi:hypothetical protein